MTRTSDHRRYQRALRALFLGRPLPSLSGSLQEHLASCASCRALYAQLVEAERDLGQACGVETDFTPLESRVAWDRISRDLGLPAPKSSGSQRFIRFALAAAVGGLLLLGAALIIPGDPLVDEGWQARGVEAAASVDLVCIGSPEGRPIRPAGTIPGRFVCRIDETLGFTYLNPGGRFSALAVWACDSSGECLWYLPDPAEPGSVSIEPAERPRALERTVRLHVNHRPGRYQLKVLFSRTPLDFEQIQRIAAGRGSPPREAALFSAQLEVIGP
ncbi:MAG: hypothetical protein JXR96_14790 [Deltaproteobacteria bacterium]|nr:hypothetical protein [Deltaproteobacteria bacterium]